MSASAGAGAGLLAAEAPKPQQYYEVQHFQMKNGPQAQRTNEFFQKYYVPAIKKLGMPPVGFFNRPAHAVGIDVGIEHGLAVQMARGPANISW